MRDSRTRWLRTAVVAALAVAASSCAARAAPEAPPTRSTAELEALYRARADSARTRYTEADVRFMTGMIAHHAQALLVAGLASDRAGSRAVRTLAARIINAQEDEIASMQQWLRERGQPVPEVHVVGTEVMVHGGGDHSAHMAGMLTPEQLRDLERANGVEFDRLFLRSMIQHHQGAIVMVDELLATDGAAQDEAVFKLASDIQVDQATEIARMETMLAEITSSP